MHGHADDHGCALPKPRECPCSTCTIKRAQPLASRPAPLDERHIDIIARRVVELLAEKLK